MELLQKQFRNKEAQFREMSAQLTLHLNSIGKMTDAITAIRSANEKLHVQITEKDLELQKVLSEKSELFETLLKLESSPESIAKPILLPSPEEKIEEKSEKTLEFPIESKPIEEESKEEQYISNEIDITAELEKLGLVDLIKKY